MAPTFPDFPVFGRRPCHNLQIVAGDELSDSIAARLEGPLATAAREGAQAEGGKKAGRDSQSKAISNICWLLAPFLGTFKNKSPSSWTIDNNVPLKAAHGIFIEEHPSTTAEDFTSKRKHGGFNACVYITLVQAMGGNFANFKGIVFENCPSYFARFGLFGPFLGHSCDKLYFMRTARST